ncbi:hypothetical protein SAMN04488003_105127 [Loktanella fryxellensis]|uniref:ABC-type transport auxiliary lipoprotein component domain-containing protein n=1 Tax=Loktanella fryxellensis TaxID=245187 RepID=A0A1H8BPZ8_9RHOB|nr:ABC-type transport auxiliary lipoprotein family protein [Loktanella fryxellensis]SEM84873.1 hypothetical protein SAMN04488003_105127 [Loktanella fryxellensis]
MLKPTLALAALAIAAACGNTLTRLDVPVVASTLQVNASVSSVMVRSVSLPTYASAEEIALETEPGVITSDGKLLSADDPSRAVTLSLTQSLDGILDATVGPDPWPFAGIPDVSVDVRVSEMLGSAVTGTFRLAGQYYIGGDGIDFADRSRTFAYTIPMPTADVPGAVAAQGTAVVQLAEEIARQLSR